MPDHEKPPPPPHVLWAIARVVVYLLCGIALTLSIWVFGALMAASSFQEGIDHSLFLCTPCAAVTFIVILVLQYSIARLYRRRREENPAVTLWEILPTLITILLLALLTSYELAQEPRFENFVASSKPASVTDLHCWHKATLGERTRMYYFRIDPMDFDKLLAAREYQREYEPAGYDMRMEGFPDALPVTGEPIVYRYRCEKRGADGGVEKLLYTNERRDTVYFSYSLW